LQKNGIIIAAIIIILKADSISIMKKPNQLRGWGGKPRVLKKDSRVALNDIKRRPGFFLNARRISAMNNLLYFKGQIFLKVEKWK